ncbi:unnamed protein product [Adineta steineri]|uniref:MATH domain-containing protein n=1 Tax=Adineta steineri TaxID=433720 RepID=A0A815JXF5_9BILA|nr:unnamed protein product [Adineta steineri]CAF1419166.1 unnamed protein product [Adineta steineri]CAF3609213.1 unnamed protein product [Adineta steineri]CAF3868597.1 unnamed protein product [Adineta steineri]
MLSQSSNALAFNSLFFIRKVWIFILTLTTNYDPPGNVWYCFDVLSSIAETIWILLFTLSLLIHFYSYHVTSKQSLWSLLCKDPVEAYLFTISCIDLHLSEDRLDARTSSDRLDEFLEIRDSRLLPFNVGVYNNNDDDFPLDEEYYQSKYKNIRLYRIRSEKKKWTSNNADQTIESQSNVRTTTDLQVPLKYNLVVKNINDIDQQFICQSCHLILRQPFQLRCGHRQCQSCIEAQNHSTIHCFSCSEVFTINEVDESKREEHYLTSTHQILLLNVLRRLKSTRGNYDQRHIIEFLKALAIVSNDAAILSNSMQQIAGERDLRQQTLQRHNHEFSMLKILIQNRETDLHRFITIQNALSREILSIEQQLDDKQIISFDGRLKWKIADFQSKLYDARSERQRSIYSPEFYSSKTGYKMCSRLFLNGINDARNTHMSIYFILMLNEYDAILEWPFHYKVKFSLINKDNQHHFVNFFWPDINSICFQRPRLQMNEGYGFEKFISLEEFQQKQDQYIQDDTIFIEIKVDFISKPPENWSDSGQRLLEDEQHIDTIDGDIMQRALFSMHN